MIELDRVGDKIMPGLLWLREKVDSLASNEKIVFITGAFDVLHEGHTKCLRHVRSLGDFLVVGINDDDFVRRIKGADRPYNGQYVRALQVAKLGYVDAVCIFSFEQQVAIIDVVKPNIFIMSTSSHRKPKDRLEQIVAVKRNGGRIRVFPPFSNTHSTELIKAPRAANQ